MSLGSLIVGAIFIPRKAWTLKLGMPFQEELPELDNFAHLWNSGSAYGHSLA